MNQISHVAIIMDGNGRWAEHRGLPRWKGHEAGAAAVRRTVEEAVRQQIPVLTLFAFSSENWKRPAREVSTLFSLFRRFLRDERSELVKNGVRLTAIGRRDRLPVGVAHLLARTEAATHDCGRLHLRLALDYGARHEILQAVRALVRLSAEQQVDPEQIDEARFGSHLYGDPVPDPDLIIRTAGERRLSNFLLWQAAYSEFYFCPKLWPDFLESDFQEAIADYHARTRKFGAVQATGTTG